ncbi:hypothetical protein DKL61_07545 [Gammaproteobacteria bacterium ESL0073]|nr:hypothetical protein DKL61_07545 [Gammaproteobacteria bacterium ESL0073]
MLMTVSTLLRSACLAGSIFLVAGCATESQPKLTPAQQAIASMSYEQKTVKFLEIIHADKFTTLAYVQAQDVLNRLFVVSKAPESKRAVLERYEAQANAILDKAIGWDVIKPDVIRLYQANFTDAELAQMIEFYDSPTGKKMLRQLPEINAQVEQLIGSKLERGAAPQIQGLIESMAKELNFSLNSKKR